MYSSSSSSWSSTSAVAGQGENLDEVSYNKLTLMGFEPRVPATQKCARKWRQEEETRVNDFDPIGAPDYGAP